MNYIVMDMEWNQPLSYDSHVYKLVGDRLLFEVIQIGAVKMNETLEMVDSISIPVRPTHYVKIHPRIKRMTGLNSAAFEDAPYFAEALEQFAAWCGEDYVLLTWGCDDVSVLAQNRLFFNCDTELSKLYDIQRLYSQVFELGKDRKGLSAAMENLGIEPDETKQFHNALNDAYYTAQVFQKLPSPEKVLQFEETPKTLTHVHRAEKKYVSCKRYDSFLKAFQSEDAQAAPCPICKKPTLEDGHFIRQTGNKYAGLRNCNEHGAVFVQLLLTPENEGRVIMAVTTSLANKLKVAYLHTKQLQPIPTDDPQKALYSADRSNMPFED